MYVHVFVLVVYILKIAILLKENILYLLFTLDFFKIQTNTITIVAIDITAMATA